MRVILTGQVTKNNSMGIRPNTIGRDIAISRDGRKCYLHFINFGDILPFDKIEITQMQLIELRMSHGIHVIKPK